MLGSVAHSVEQMRSEARSSGSALDLPGRERTSPFPWRGQFSPQLVEMLLEEMPSDGCLVDPFVGSGTLLYEAGHAGRDAIGTEINSAALAMASLAEFIEVPVERRVALLRELEAALASTLPSDHPPGSLFSEPEPATAPTAADPESLLRGCNGDWLYSMTIRVVLLLAMKNGKIATPAALRGAFHQVQSTIVGLPYSPGRRQAIAADARSLPCEDGSVAGVITSPPYINVFNYHQNYRPCAETLGTDVLAAARSEIGSNRKHRQNRFLTVVQYAMDMNDVLDEIHRVLLPASPAVVVIGRESNVRGVPFENGLLLGMLALTSGKFEIDLWRERSFVSRFGGRIYEDVITLKTKMAPAPSTADPRAIGEHFLTLALKGDCDPAVRSDLESALAASGSVKRSPSFDARSLPWADSSSAMVS